MSSLTKRSALSVLLGVLLGVAFAHLLLIVPPIIGITKIQSWAYIKVPREGIAKLWYQAWMAHNGPFALSEEEAIYLTRSHDDEGHKLREDCRYQLTGSGFPASWWSISVYGNDPKRSHRSTSKSSLSMSELAHTKWELQLTRAPSDQHKSINLQGDQN